MSPDNITKSTIPPCVTFHNLTGLRFGARTVTGYYGFHLYDNGRKKHYWEFACDCGTVALASNDSLKKSDSCGCLSSLATTKRNLSHGLSKSMPEYKIWKGMKTRCYNANRNNYENYGGRGICVCERWINDFQAFINDMGCRPTPLHSLERIDNNKNYEPDNCKWATRIEQNRNTRRTKKITYNGVTLTLREWSEKLGIKYDTLHGRIFDSKWKIEDALASGGIQPN